MTKHRIVKLKSGDWKVQRRYFGFLWLYDLNLFSWYEKNITKYSYERCQEVLKEYINSKGSNSIIKVVEYSDD